MSARSPFRSHLLQQWTNSRRSPIVVQQWLQQATIDEEEEGVVPSSVPTTRSSRHNRREHSRRSMHLSSRQQQQLHPDLSSVDSSPSSPSIAMSATASWASSLKSKDTNNNVVHHNSIEKGLLNKKDRQKIEIALRDIVTPRNIATSVYGMTYAPVSIKNKIRDHGKSIDSLTLKSANNLQKIRDHRKSIDSLTLKSANNSQKDEEKDRPELQLAMAIRQAVKMAKTTTNARRNNNDQSRADEEDAPPFTFRRLLSSSSSGQRLIDICFEVALRTTSDDAFPRNERDTWSEVPAFLVAIVHNNQNETPVMATTATTTNVVEKDDDDDDDDNDPYKVLGYSPPVNEGQLEDYASACAAVQSVIHSLDGDGFNAEWVTGSLIKTPAFRSLVRAKPTDRIAALIKVHDRPTRCEELSSRLTEDDGNHARTDCSIDG